MLVKPDMSKLTIMKKARMGDHIYGLVSHLVFHEQGIYNKGFNTINIIQSNHFMGLAALELGLFADRVLEKKPKGFCKEVPKVYADNFEAYFFDLFQESGIEGCKQFFIEKILPLCRTHYELTVFLAKFNNYTLL